MGRIQIVAVTGSTPISMYVSEALKGSNLQNQSMNINYTNNATKLNKPFVRDTISGYI
jgi:hypothetical protein